MPKLFGKKVSLILQVKAERRVLNAIDKTIATERVIYTTPMPLTLKRSEIASLKALKSICYRGINFGFWNMSFDIERQAFTVTRYHEAEDLTGWIVDSREPLWTDALLTSEKRRLNKIGAEAFQAEIDAEDAYSEEEVEEEEEEEEEEDEDEDNYEEEEEYDVPERKTRRGRPPVKAKTKPKPYRGKVLAKRK